MGRKYKVLAWRRDRAGGFNTEIYTAKMKDQEAVPKSAAKAKTIVRQLATEHEEESRNPGGDRTGSRYFVLLLFCCCMVWH